MELKVFWLEFAENKLEDIYAFYSVKAGKRIAKKLINGIVDATIGIEKHPESGQIEINLQHREQEFRYLLFKNYKIVYRVNHNYNRVEIANIFDTRQNPEKINETK